jgi:NAD(P)H-flavin reductase
VRSQYLPAKAVITEVLRETEDVWTFSLRPVGGRALGPFLPGQFNMLGFPGVGEAAISISSRPEKDLFLHTIRAVGRVTKFLTRLQPGNEFFWRGPYGRAWPVKQAEGQDLLLVAGGVGLAPLRPVIEAVFTRRAAFGKVTLIYGARDPGSLLYTALYDRWRRNLDLHLTVDQVPTCISWPHGVGLVTGPLEKVALDLGATIAFVCGPEIMMRFVARQLLLARLSSSSLYVSLERRMKCGIGQCGHCQHGTTFVCKDGPVFLYRDVRGFPDSLL